MSAGVCGYQNVTESLELHLRVVVSCPLVCAGTEL